jgi:hypothetical protein
MLFLTIADRTGGGKARIEPRRITTRFEKPRKLVAITVAAIALWLR